MQTLTRRRALGLLAALLASPAALVGCGGDDGDGDMTADMTTELVIDPADIEIGHHAEFVSRDPPTEWMVLDDGGFLPVVLGGQGINMILVGMRTRIALVEPVQFRLWLVVNGDRQGQATWSNQIFAGEDEGGGWRGIYNLFVSLDGCRSFAEGSPGELTIEITDGTSGVWERVIPITVGENDLC